MTGRILIVDDVATNRILYQARFSAAFYEPVLAADGAGCLEAARDQRPDLILLDLMLPDMSGHEVLRRLRADPRTRMTPVIVLTATKDDAGRLAAFSAGADDVIVKPASDQVLLARVRNLLRARAECDFATDSALATGLADPAALFEPAATVALVAARADQSGALERDLAGMLRGQLRVLSRPEALAEAALATRVPDVFIVQEDSNDGAAALRLLSELKSHQATRHSAVCVLGRSGVGDEAAIAFDLGADDVVGPDVTPAELALRTRSLVRRKRQGDRQRARMQDNLRLALVDPLTGLYNRRHALPELAAIAARATQTGAYFAVMVIDLDRFKQVNDQHGHAAGDRVLVEVSRRLTANLRATDLLARIGGEEFLVVLPDCPMAEARRIAERLCEAVEERPIRLSSGLSLAVTVSIGVSVAGGRLRQPIMVDEVVEQADLALLDSKGAGRNQVTYRLSAA